MPDPHISPRLIPGCMLPLVADLCRRAYDASRNRTGAIMVSLRAADFA